MISAKLVKKRQRGMLATRNPLQKWVLSVLADTNCNRQGLKNYFATTGVSVTGPSRPQSVSGHCEASKGL
jgi:hypothetical protein